jgi:hypothetical protein
MPITIAQSSTPTGKDRWLWSVWLEGTEAELDGVEHVIYTLHPTFAVPVQRVSNRASRFRLESGGWGEFAIHAEVHRRDGGVDTLRHWLRLGSDTDRWLHAAGAAVPPERTRRSISTPECIYLSYSVADARAGHALQALLIREAGLAVRTSEELAETPEETPFDGLVERELRAASAAVFLISANPNSWLRRELEIADTLDVPRVFVSVRDAALPMKSPPGAHFLHLRLEPDSVEQVARDIASFVRGAG